MKRASVLLASALLVLFSVPVVAWSPAWDKDPPIPMRGFHDDGIGRCVTLYDGTEFIGATINRTEDMRRANENRASYAISTYNAVTLIAQGVGRPDLAAAAVDLRFVRTGEQVASPEGAAIMVCECQNTIWSGDPRRGGKVTGCGGGCGSCTRCVLIQPK